MINLRTKASRHSEQIAQLRMIMAAEKRMRVRFEQELNRVAKEAAAAYPRWDGVLTGHQKRMQKLLMEEDYRAALVTGQRSRAALLRAMRKSEQKLDSEDELIERIVKWASKNSAKRVTGVVKTTQKRIANAVKRGLADELSPAQIARSIVGEVGGMSRSRAFTIARTEAHSASMTGQHLGVEETAEELGLTMRKRWMATIDERTRESHAEADGQEVDLDEDFSVGEDSLRYPGDPDAESAEVINCRCTISYDAK